MRMEKSRSKVTDKSNERMKKEMTRSVTCEKECDNWP